jgi:hypothetical protein
MDGGRCSARRPGSACLDLATLEAHPGQRRGADRPDRDHQRVPAGADLVEVVGHPLHFAVIRRAVGVAGRVFRRLSQAGVGVESGRGGGRRATSQLRSIGEGMDLQAGTALDMRTTHLASAWLVPVDADSKRPYSGRRRVWCPRTLAQVRHLAEYIAITDRRSDRQGCICGEHRGVAKRGPDSAVALESLGRPRRHRWPRPAGVDGRAEGALSSKVSSTSKAASGPARRGRR